VLYNPATTVERVKKEFEKAIVAEDMGNRRSSRTRELWLKSLSSIVTHRQRFRNSNTEKPIK